MDSVLRTILCSLTIFLVSISSGVCEKEQGWTFSLTDEGKPVLRFKVDRKLPAATEEAYSLDGLKAALEEYREANPKEKLKNLDLFDFLRSPVLQRELFEQFRKTHPELLTAAMKSGGNMHNPKVIPLRKELIAMLQQTPTFLEMNRLFSDAGLQPGEMSFEKLWIEKDDDGTFLRFFFTLWIELKEAQASNE